MTGYRIAFNSEEYDPPGQSLAPDPIDLRRFLFRFDVWHERDAGRAESKAFVALQEYAWIDLHSARPM